MTIENKKPRLPFLLIAFLALAFAAACSGSESDEPCTDGATQSCTCPTGAAGEQICTAGGFGECECFGRGGGVEPVPDAAPDAGRDVPEPDAGDPDVTEPDSGLDADRDSGPTDTRPDAEPDTEPDAEPDATPDAEPDAIEDAVPDVVPDASADADVDVVPDLPDAEPDIPPEPGPLPACTAHGGSCDDPGDTTEDFFCDWGEETCVARCDLASADRTGSEDCPVGSYCLIELTGGDPGELTGACAIGDCTGSVFDPRGCDSDQTCLAVGNGASYCIDAGDVAEGEECGVSPLDDPPASDRCEPGLLCLLHECVEPCRIGAGCDGAETCVGVFDTTPLNRAGACATVCPDFGTCATGICEPVFGRSGINAWICDDTPGLRGGDGEECVGPRELCEEGLVCLNLATEDDPELQCVRECLPPEAADCSFGDTCVPAGAPGYGFCLDQCDPYPRSSAGCGVDETCFPFVATRASAVTPDGYCGPDLGTVGPGGVCTDDGFLGGDCEDFAVCLDLADDGTSECLPLCDPFASGECSGFPTFSTCSGIPPLVGELAFSFCVDAQPGSVGGFCLEEGFPCSADGTVCLDMDGFGAECLAVCRVGFSDCRSGSCRTDGLSPEVVPPYMGLCR